MNELSKETKEISSIFVKEADRCVERWSRTEYLNGITDPHILRCTAICLENQFLFAEAFAKEGDDRFWKASFKIVSNVFSKLIAYDIGSVQPLLGPAGLVYFKRFRYSSPKPTVEDSVRTVGRIPVESKLDIWGGDESKTLPEINLIVESEDIAAKTRRLKTLVSEDFDSDEGIEKVSKSILRELNSETLVDLLNNCGTVAKVDSRMLENKDSLYIKLCELSSVIHRKTLRGGTNVIALNQKTFDKYSKDINAYNPTRVKKIINEDMPDSTILLGYRGDEHIDAGYFLSPYVPLAKSPINASSSGLLFRYGKKLLREGSKFYCKLEIVDEQTA